MQQWEYCWKRFPANLDDEIGPPEQKMRVADVMNRLGTEGWEMVSVQREIPNNGFSYWIAFFKRPKP
jgi:hypothetical protein